VLSRVRDATNQDVVDMGHTLSHIANLAANELVKQIPLPVEDLLVDTYYHIDKR